MNLGGETSINTQNVSDFSTILDNHLEMCVLIALSS